MSFAYALTFFCEVLLYFGGVGCLGLLRACPDRLYLVPLLLLAGCWLCGRLMGRGRLRWLPVAVVLPCLLVAGNWPGRIVSLPALAYLPLYVENNRRAPDYDYAVERFRHSLIAAGVVLLLAVLFRAGSWTRGLPYLFLYFTLNVTLLRLLRHDDSVARSRRFRALNLGGVALVCAAGFGLSQPAIVAAVKVAWGWFLDNVILNIVALVLYILQWVLFGLSWVLAKLLPSGGLEFGGLPQTDLNGDAGPRLEQAAQEVRMLPPFVRLMIQGAGIALLALVAFLLLRALSRRVARAEHPTGNDVRESLDAEGPKRSPGRRARRGEPDEGVRQWYRRALLLVKGRGGRVAPTMNTLQLQDESEGLVDGEAMRELRALYLPVRYGGRPASPGDVARAKSAYERAKKRDVR